MTEGSVFKMTATTYSGDTLDYKIGEGLPGKYYGRDFEQSEKDGVLMAVSGFLGWPEGGKETPIQQPEGGEEAKELLFLCKNIRIKEPYTEEWRKMGCDLNVVNGKLQVTWLKTAANPQGISFIFNVPKVL